ncbi:MAG: AgmX/PglI C-terminal domain-containing protein [Bdellovibrionaceae bacterium]|nr:AgmX/PglI C-terminal domain-containing protein [Pseudobdellovibrionaceae bacterium]
MSHLYLLNSSQETVRVFNLQSEKASLVYCFDNQRLELIVDFTQLKKENRSFETLVEFNLAEDNNFPLSIPGWGILSKDEGKNVFKNVNADEENKKPWWTSLGIVAMGGIVFSVLVQIIPQFTPKLEEELKQHVVKIIKRAPKQISQPASMARMTNPTQKVEIKKNQPTVKRMGALAVLGRLNKKSKNKGGLNLGAVKVSPGPGLGGTQGSGGMQTSLYGKGIIAAPVGAGNNIRGAGGYGTKGKGGGQDGFGQMSLVGSLGTSSIPLGKEAIIQGGLDQESIFVVIQKNMGQIRFCYEQGLQTDPKLMGRVAVDFIIGGSGSVKTANLSSSTLQSKLVENCILMRLKTWKFPLPEGGVDVKVSYPFMLRRLGTG